MKTKICTILFLPLIISLAVNAQSNTIGPGIALSQDGSDANYIDLGDVYNSINFPLTFETWIYPTAFATPYNGIFATDSKNTGSYYGFYVRVTSLGKLSFEIGDGLGAGSTHRRGKVTTTSVALNTWTHIAVVATSATDIKFYFNGILQSNVNSDGGSGVTNIVHNSNPAEYGRYATQFDVNNFQGQLDDARLWTVSRTEADIRANMCHKLLGTETGLTGYWNADESYASTTVNDLTTPAENGTIAGTVNKITSGAPIGDISTNHYVVDWSGVTLSLNSPGGDKLKINKILNSPVGVHLYRVNSGPYYFDGLSGFTNYYYGVFTINGATEAKYTATYLYSLSNGVTTVDNEVNSKLSIRNNASVMSWSDAGASLNTTGNKLTKKNVTSMKEFIYNNVIPGGARYDILELSDKSGILPNPSNGVIYISKVATDDHIIITDLMGNIVFETTTTGASNLYQVDLEDLSAGIYVANIQKQDGTVNSSKFIITK